MTLAESKVELRALANQLLTVEDRQLAACEAVSRKPDEDAMFQG